MACQQVAGGWQCEQGKPISFNSPYDPQNPLTSHMWTIDGVQASTAPSFQQTFAALGTHTVLHSGANACGGQCSQSTQLEIVQAIQPPAAQAAPAAASAAPLALIGGLLAFGMLGIIMTKRK